MKKIIYLILAFALLWLVKLSYDLYGMTQQLESIQSDLHQHEQKSAALNDQLIALQRDVEVIPATRSTTTVKAKQEDNSEQGLSPLFLIKQKLELVQFALQQQQFVYALEKLNELDVAIEQYALADTLKQSLHQTIDQDKQSIQQFMKTQTQQQEKITQTLFQLDQLLTAQVQNTQLKPTQSKTQSWWEKWFSVERVEQAKPSLSNRQMILKEVQVRVLSAQQSLLHGQIKEYQNMLELAIQQLSYLPDADSQKLKQKLIQLKQLQLITVPKLNSLTMVG